MTINVQNYKLFNSKKKSGFQKSVFVIEQIQLAKILINANKNCILDVLKLEIDPVLNICKSNYQEDKQILPAGE